jgi:hypothetical protein
MFRFLMSNEHIFNCLARVCTVPILFSTAVIIGSPDSIPAGVNFLFSGALPEDEERSSEAEMRGGGGGAAPRFVC